MTTSEIIHGLLFLHILLSIICVFLYKLSEKHGVESVKDELNNMIDTDRMVIIFSLIPVYNLRLIYSFIKNILLGIKEKVFIKKILRELKKKSPEVYKKVMKEYSYRKK